MIIENAPLIPKWEVDLRRQALINSTHASTSIEGNQLTAEEVSDLLIGRKITASARDKKEVLNYFEALRELDDLKDNKEIREKDILKLHKIITKDVLDDPKNSGAYRTPEDEKKRGRVVVVERIGFGQRRITFLPPKAKAVLEEMKKFVDWINCKETEEIDPVLEAGIAHYEFVRIHPFVDGNGRTSRTLASLILLRRGFDTKRFFALDDYYNADRRSYYQALKSVDPDKQDLTGWLEYFSKGVAISLNAVKNKVLVLTGGKAVKQEGKQIAVDDQQIKIIEYLQKERQITNKDLRKLFKISHQRSYEILNQLLENKIIKRKGKGRSVYYILG